MPVGELLIGLASLGFLALVTSWAVRGLREALETGVARGRLRPWSRSENPMTFWQYTVLYAFSSLGMAVIWLSLAWRLVANLMN